MNKLWVITLIFLSLVGITAADTCQYYTYATASNSIDFIGINTTTNNTVTFSSNQVWGNFAFFTPRLNFTSVVTDTLVGHDTVTSTLFNWQVTGDNYSNINNSLVLKNVSTTIGRGNYTLTNTSGTQYVIVWGNNGYNN